VTVEETTFVELISGEYDYRPPERGDIRQGVLLSLEGDEAVVDVGAKREGVVPRRDLQLLGEEAVEQLSVGDDVSVYVMSPQDEDGNLVVSLNRVKQEEGWLRAEELKETGEVREGEVIDHNRGGLLISCLGLRAFLPQSQIAALPRGLSREERMKRLPSLVGEKLPYKVIEVDRRRRRLVVSNRDAVREWERKQRERLLEELMEGDVVRGKVSSLRDFGAFVDLGGADGLIHISELAWRRVKHPSEVLERGQEVVVYVLRLDHERKRISLSLRRLLPDPWTMVEQRISPGDVVEGEVMNVVEFGVFVRLEEGVEGLVHLSEMPRELSPQAVVARGDKVSVRVLRIDTARKRIGLSLRDLPVSAEVGAADHGVAQTEAKPQFEEGTVDPTPERHLSSGGPSPAESPDGDGSGVDGSTPMDETGHRGSEEEPVLVPSIPILSDGDSTSEAGDPVPEKEQLTAEAVDGAVFRAVMPPVMEDL
jgi:small subunit ribosomal protein S1